MKRKILAFSSIRSDYDLMSPLYRLLQADTSIDLRLVVSGAHMSYTYGHTVDMVEQEGLNILQGFETLLDANTKQSRAKSAGILLQNAIDIVGRFAPDLIIYAGDREDVLVAAMIAGYLEIPSLHFYGGDHVRDGYIDNPVRHAVSKLSTAHMVTLEQHKIRLVKMGEAPERVHVIGNISLDNIVNHIPEPIDSIKKQLGIPSDFNSSALVIFHPTSEEIDQCSRIFENILMSLKDAGIFGFVSYPNVDPGNRSIIEVCRRYQNDKNFFFYRNLKRELFLSIYKTCNLIIGNSSSGVLESASIPVPAVNVGLRQRGRFSPANVLFCDGDYSSIKSAVHQAISREFFDKIKAISNPYGDGKSAQMAYQILRGNDFRSLLGKKEDPLDF